MGTSLPFVNELLIGNLWRPGQTSDQTVYAIVPVSTPGLTLVCRQSNATPDADPYDHPLSRIGDELDGMAYFDDVFIPWDQVQHIGNPDHAKLYPQRQFDWVHIETQVRHAVHAELIVGLALLLTNALGTNNSPIVQSQLADLVRFRETCKAFAIAAEETGFTTAGGLFKPNNIYVDLGRAHYLESIHSVVNQLIEFCGRGVVIRRPRRTSITRSWAPSWRKHCVGPRSARVTGYRSSGRSASASSPNGAPDMKCSRSSTGLRCTWCGC